MDSYLGYTPRARIDGMSSRRDKDKLKKNVQDKSSRAERLDRRTSNNGLEGAVAAAAVTSRPANKLRTPSVSASPPKNNLKGSSANSSPIKKRSSSSSAQAKRARPSVSSEHSSDEDGPQKLDEDEVTVTGANTTNLADAAAKLKKRSNITVGSNYFLFNKLKSFDAS